MKYYSTDLSNGFQSFVAPLILSQSLPGTKSTMPLSPPVQVGVWEQGCGLSHGGDKA